MAATNPLTDVRGPVSNEEFAERAKPLSDALASVVIEARGDRADLNIQGANSPAMADYAAQPMFPDSEEGAIDVVRTLSGLGLLAAEDHILAARTLIDQTTETFVWSVPVLGRAALESLGQVGHLTELRISTTLRAGRAMNELIYSAQNIRRLPQPLQTQGSDPAHRDVQALSMGLTRVVTRKGKPTEWFEERRPSNTELVAGLFPDGHLGATIYNYWSAVAHASSWGLTQTLGEPSDHPSGFGFVAPIVSSLHTLLNTALLLVLAHLEAMEHLSLIHI